MLNHAAAQRSIVEALTGARRYEHRGLGNECHHTHERQGHEACHRPVPVGAARNTVVDHGHEIGRFPVGADARLGPVEALDNPVWQALTGPHATVAEGGAFARRYRPEYSVWCAVHDDADPAAWSEMRAIVGPGGHALFSGHPRHPTNWTVDRQFQIRQLVLDHPIDNRSPRGVTDRIRLLGPADASAMAVLAETTKPGPWCARTPELGNFFGIDDDGGLAAMAGERLQLPTAVEISGVCTDERARGHGYGAALVVTVATQIQARGALPFLHVREANTDAIRLYERLGFRVRLLKCVALLRAPED